MDDILENPVEATVGKRLLDTVGYLAVAFLCTITGYSLSSSGGIIVNGVVPIEVVPILCYIFILSAYFYSREALLERKSPKYSKALESDGLHLPLIFFILITSLSFLLLYVFYTPKANVIFNGWMDICLAISISVVPFVFLWLNSFNKVKKGQFQEAYRFQDKVLFPAIYTCLISFSFGWALHGEQLNINLLLLVSSTTIVLKIASMLFKANMGYLVLSIFIFLLVLIFGLKVFDENILKPMLYGLIITLALGVSEAQKRVYLAQIKDSYQPPGEGGSFLFAGANWASIIFPLFLALIPLLSDDFTSWPILFFILIQVSHWFWVDNPNVTIKEYRQSRAIGFCLPLVFIGVSYLDLNPTFVEKENLASLMSLVGLFIAIAAFIVKKPTRSSFLLEITNDAFLNRRNRYIAFIYSLIALDLISFAIAILTDSFTDAVIIKQKVSEIILFSFAILMTVTFIYYKKDGGTPLLPPRNKKAPVRDNPTEESRNQLRCLLKTLRIETSIIPGIAVFSLGYISHGLSMFSAVVGGIIFTLITMFGFLVNDIFDYYKDKLAGVDRPIAKDQLSSINAILYALVLSILVIGISVFVDNEDSFLIVSSTLFVLIMYSHISKYAPIAKGFVTALLCLSPIAYSSSISDASASYLLYVFIFIFIFGRELVMDGMDYLGDAKSGLKTLPAYIGISKSKQYGWLLMFISSLAYMLINLYSPMFFLQIIGTLLIALGYLAFKKNEQLGEDFSRGALFVYAASLPFAV